jgi:4-hydroxy-tetrahydrodipicolinate reductase
MQQLSIIVHGASGRMGREVCALVEAAADLQLAARLPGVWPESPTAQTVVVDFSLPTGLATLVEHCRTRRLPLVCGTTGLDEAGRALLHELAQDVPVLWAANFSLGVAVLKLALVELARRLPGNWDTAIVDLHHRHKRDAPSGTALGLAQLIDQQRPQGAGKTDVISARLGEINGEHRLIFAGASERIELLHHADHRRLFAEGALHAARWLVGRAPGWYEFEQTIA